MQRDRPATGAMRHKRAAPRRCPLLPPSLHSRPPAAARAGRARHGSSSSEVKGCATHMLLAWLAAHFLPLTSTSGCGEPEAKMARPCGRNEQAGEACSDAPRGCGNAPGGWEAGGHAASSCSRSSLVGMRSQLLRLPQCTSDAGRHAQRLRGSRRGKETETETAAALPRSTSVPPRACTPSCCGGEGAHGMGCSLLPAPRRPTRTPMHNARGGAAPMRSTALAP